MPSIEQWRPVVGWEGLYEVSDHGRVRSLERVVQFGCQQRTAPSRILKPGQNVHGVPFVNLSGGGKRHIRSVHTLVLEAFVGPRTPGYHGCHWNDVKTDNRVENLRWDTASANARDKIRNGHDHQVNKTHCPHGHEYTPENTKLHRGGRWCRECHRADNRERYWRDIENQRAYKRESQRRSRQARRERAQVN